MQLLVVQVVNKVLEADNFIYRSNRSLSASASISFSSLIAMSNG
jgi:hypothetical protein